MLARLVPLSLATPIAYYVFAIWYRGADTSPAQHPVSLPVGVVIAATIVLVPAGLALQIARRRGHGWLSASCIAFAEVALAAALVPVLLILLTIIGGVLTNDRSYPRHSGHLQARTIRVRRSHFSRIAPTRLAHLTRRRGDPRV